MLHNHKLHGWYFLHKIVSQNYDSTLGFLQSWSDASMLENEKLCLQRSQLYRSISCTNLICLFKSPFWAKLLSHLSQLYRTYSCTLWIWSCWAWWEAIMKTMSSTQNAHQGNGNFVGHTRSALVNCEFFAKRSFQYMHCGRQLHHSWWNPLWPFLIEVYRLQWRMETF